MTRMPSAVLSDRLPGPGRLVDLSMDAAGTQRKPLPVHIIVAGVVGTLLVACGGISAAAVQQPVPLLEGTAFSWLGHGSGRHLALVAVYVGIALIVLSWIQLGRDALAGGVDRRGILVTIGAWVLPLIFTPPLFSRDIFSYLAQGDLAVHGFDPYSYGVSVLHDHLSTDVDPTWLHTPAPYGPLFILLAKVVVLVTGQNTIVGILVMRATMCTGLVLLCWALPRLAERLGGSPVWALWFGAANPFVLTYLVAGGHNDLLMTGLMAAGTVLVLDARHRTGFLAVTLAFAVKATAAVLLPFLVWIWAARLAGPPLRRFAKATAGGFAVVVPTFAVCTFAAGVNLGWIPALSSSSGLISWLSVPTGIGQFAHRVARVVDTHANLATYLAVTRDLGFVVLLVLVVWLWWRARDGQPITTVRRAAVALLVVALFSPVTLPWYFSWSLVVAAGLAWSRRAMVFGMFGSVWLILVTYPDGASGLYDWVYLAAGILAATLAAVSLVASDPLGMSSRDLRALTAEMRANGRAQPRSDQVRQHLSETS